MPQSVMTGTAHAAPNQSQGQPLCDPIQGNAYTSTGGIDNRETTETVGPNEGNAVFSSPTQRTSDLYKTHSTYDPSQPLPERFDNPELTKGYNTSKLTSTNPMFFTSSQTYGSLAPSVHTMPAGYHGRSNKFSEHLGNAGMPCNRSLNTKSDRSAVHASLDQTNTNFAFTQGASPRH